jgi:V8-like Glu-specific endopeptidase
MRISGIVLSLGIGLAGCGGGTIGDGSGDGISSAPIIGGVNDPGDPSVAAFLINSSKGTGLCTATVIGKRLLLTAAHCVNGAGNGDTFQARFSTSAFAGGKLVNVVKTDFDRQFNEANLGGSHDIAVAVLAEDAPAPAIKVSQTVLQQADVGADIRIVGFGNNVGGANATGAGTKRQTNVKVEQVLNSTPAKAQTGVASALFRLGDSQDGTCNGDSGGPAFRSVNGVDEVIGVTSFGDVNCAVNGFDTSTAAFFGFLKPFLDADGGAAGGGNGGGGNGGGGAPPPAVCGDQEPNNDPNSASTLCAQGAFQLSSGSLAAGDSDFYSFDVAAGQTFNLIDVSNARNLITELSVIDNGTQRIVSQLRGGNVRAAFRSNAARKVFIEVTSTDGKPVAKYTVAIQTQ